MLKKYIIKSSKYNFFIIYSLVLFFLTFLKEDELFFYALFVIVYIVFAVFTLRKKMAFVPNSIIFLMLFDYDRYFGFTYFNIRPWYAFFPFVLIGIIKTNRSSFFYFILFLAFLNSVIFGGVVDYFKYLIYILTAYHLTNSYRNKHIDYLYLFHILGIPIYYTFIQYLFFYITGSFQSLWGNEMRPSGFFSESTWMGAFCVVYILYAIHIRTRRNFNVEWNIAIATIILLMTYSINAYISLFLISLYFARNVSPKYIISFLCLLLFSTTLFNDLTVNSLNNVDIVQRIKSLDEDVSALGRVTGFSIMNEYFEFSNIFGHGFLFDPDKDLLLSGAALGAKSYSFPYQIQYIFGYIGTFVLIYFVLIVILKNSKHSYFLLCLFIFFCMSFFAPLAQGVVGSFFILITFIIFYERFL